MAKPLVIDDIKEIIHQRIVLHEDGCWLWTDQFNRSGYGIMSYQGTKYVMHRLSWTVFKGRIPSDLFVLHKCDIRNCINPEHLFLGTAQDNMDDMRAKGRGRYPGRPKGKVKILDRAKKEKEVANQPSKTRGRLPVLTQEQISYIKSVYVRGRENPTMKQLAEKFQVSVTVISKAVNS